MKKVISGNQSVYHAVLLARPHVIAAYPITPQSSIVEMISASYSQETGRGEFINVESEHSAMAACIAASAMGARTFTATSSQGLALMHELLHYASGLRLPIVMVNVNRALAAPFNIKADLGDSLSQRDTGWLQFYCGSGQEVLDTVIQAYGIAEQSLLPVMVNLEGFILSHTYEIVDIPSQADVDQFLGEYHAWHSLDVENPFMLGGTTDLYINFRYKLQAAMEEALGICKAVDDSFEQIFGRKYGLLDEYRCDDADLIMVTAGTLAETCCLVADQCRKRRFKVGVVRIRLFRPMPKEELWRSVENADKILVVDRDFSPGCGGIIAQEVKAVLQSAKKHKEVIEIIAGLGGKDVTDHDIADVVGRVMKEEKMEEPLWLGLLR